MEGARVDDAGAGAVGAAGVDAVEQHAFVVALRAIEPKPAFRHAFDQMRFELKACWNPSGSRAPTVQVRSAAATGAAPSPCPICDLSAFAAADLASFAIKNDLASIKKSRRVELR